MNKNKILLTGGAGYIGSHVFISLIEAGYNPVIFDNFSRSDISMIKKLELITKQKVFFIDANLSSIDKIKYAFDKYKIEAVVHFAGFKSIEESLSKPILYYQNNLVGLINLIDIMIEYNCSNFLFSSSASIYDSDKSNKSMDENHLQETTNPYSSSKKMSEKIITDTATDNNFNYSILRYFNPAGAHDSGLIGDNFYSNPSNLFPIISKVAKKEIPFLKVFGNNYNTHDGTAIRDYIHISDLANGHILSLKQLIDKKQSHTINLGSGKGYTVLEVIECYNKFLQENLNYKFFPRRKGDKECVYADISLAKQLINWKPEKTLYDMCESSWNAVKEK